MSQLLAYENRAKAEDSANDLVHAKEFADVLTHHYPGWLWGVNVNGETGMCDIRNFNLSGSHGFRLKLPDMYTISSFKKEIIRAGGEMLERYKQPRGAFDATRWAELALDTRGIPIGDKSR